jgi:hypothetical protein
VKNIALLRIKPRLLNAGALLAAYLVALLLQIVFCENEKAPEIRLSGTS